MDLLGYPFGNDVTDPSLDQNRRLVYEYDGRSIEQVAKDLDKAYEGDHRSVIERYPDDTTFGLGISGGLDSRPILHYSKKLGIEPRVWFLGDKKYDRNRLPIIRNRLHTYDYTQAKRVCGLYDIDSLPAYPFTPRPNPGVIEEDVKGEYPFSSYNVWRYHSDIRSLPEHDVMLSGFNMGEHFGQFLPTHADRMDTGEATSYLIETFGGWKILSTE